MVRSVTWLHVTSQDLELLTKINEKNYLEGNFKMEFNWALKRKVKNRGRKVLHGETYRGWNLGWFALHGNLVEASLCEYSSHEDSL